ncbi:hypothetical protein DPMN_026215 [Dreissena polymorpha]|uniref:HTTM-like domain-containing protein n=1 Tax=Dreissena polymorpha TaxID=45954 RepID=A0A9D4REC5_DREPO|nr:hypothetical protein DPMN_026215 [Dreissena polymorpha]
MMSQLQTSLDHHSDDAYEMMKKTACKSTANGHGKTSIDTKASCDWFRGLFGFSVVDLSSQDHIMRLLFRPMDPAGLGFTRIIFGLLMLVDLWQERGLHEALDEYGDTSLCRFPLFNIWPVLPLQWIYIVYFIMFLGEVGIVLGLFYRVSCLMFVVPYWYLFLLDKTSWNNHSYLYGLCGILLLVTDTNHVWSVDGLLDSKKRNAHIPLWNYAIFRFQIFVLYFIAGLKKLDPDWILGYSMHYITGHWVFSPFRLFLTDGQMSVFIIHLGGLFIDLFIGFLLFFDQTRKYAIFVGSSFHGMNSQLFSIGMFPFVCLSTLPLFCDPGWPRLVIDRLPAWMTTLFKQESSCTTNPHCLYHKEHIKPDEKQPGGQLVTSCDPPPHTKAHGYHKAAAMFCVAYVSTQCFLPYSHFITQGYNHWAQGLYGYSWDMMVHSWKLQHIKITYIDKLTREEGYLNPKVWTLGARWSSHADMIKQYAACVEERLAGYNVTDIELHMDVWRALNGRFQQRAVDPRVDLIVAPWNPFQLTPWLFPLLVDLSDWRGKLVEIERDIFQQDSDTDVVFVADFPGILMRLTWCLWRTFQVY